MYYTNASQSKAINKFTVRNNLVRIFNMNVFTYLKLTVSTFSWTDSFLINKVLDGTEILMKILLLYTKQWSEIHILTVKEYIEYFHDHILLI